MIARLMTAAMVCTALTLSLAGCETSHSESTKQGLFGGTKHEETTTYRNPVTGDTAVEHSEQKIR